MRPTLRVWLAGLVCLTVACALRPSGSGPASASGLLGGLNGMAASYVWLYASRQQEAGNTFEMLQAAQTLAALQPRLVSLYDFQSWNLAYNVANSVHDPRDRWRWIEAGLRLLDDGIARNPRDPRIRQALASLLLDRIAAGTDPNVDLYRQAFAERWQPVFGPPPVDWTQALSSGPTGSQLDVTAAAAIDRRDGPLDWRSAQAHALYWCVDGERLVASARASRMLYAYRLEALRSAFLDGRVVSQPGELVWFTAPQPGLAASVERNYREIAARLPHDAGIQAGQDNWRRQAVLLLVAFGRRDEAAGLVREGQSADATVAAARGELLEPDPTAGPSLARNYLVRAWLCRALAEPELERGLRGMAAVLAGTDGLAQLDAEAKAIAIQQHLSPRALARL